MTVADYVRLIDALSDALRSFRSAADSDRPTASDRLHRAGIRLANAAEPDRLGLRQHYRARRILDDAGASLIADGVASERPEYIWHDVVC